MDSTVKHYDFRFGSQNAGYFSITSEPGAIAMIAVFVLEGERHENPFELRHDGRLVTAYRAGGAEWQSMDRFGANHYPTSAYPLLLPQAKPRFVYTAINEGAGTVVGQTILVRSGDMITETRGGEVTRVFRMQGDLPVEIDWGGPVSALRASLEEAKTGSPLE